MPTQLDRRFRVRNCRTGPAQMADLLRDYERWNYVEWVGVAAMVAIGVAVVALELS